MHQAIFRFGINGTTVTPANTPYAQTSPDWLNSPSTCAPLTEAVTQALSNGVETQTDQIFLSSLIGNPATVGSCGGQESCVYGFAIGSTGSPATYSLTPTGSYALNSTNNGAVQNAYTSGMIVDNTVDPNSNTCGPNGNQSCAQAASIYFTYGNDAVKLAQAQLQ